MPTIADRPWTPTAISCALCLLLFSPPSAGADPVREANAAKLDGLLNRLEARGRQQRRDRFDTDAVIEAVGRDPAKLLDWVRQQTVFVPYSGALRGWRGVLMDRVGSDVDRSLLLAQLVSSSGYAVRLARVTLTEAEAPRRPG